MAGILPALSIFRFCGPLQPKRAAFLSRRPPRRAGGADGALILVRKKRQEGAAKLCATGRDIEDVEEELDFEDCRWSRGAAMDKLRLDFLLNPLQGLLRENGEFAGTASELAGLLGEKGVIYTPRSSSSTSGPMMACL